MADTLGISTSLAEPAAVTAPRPQPLGVFGLPLGYLLIPGGPGTDHVRTALLAGQLPDTWPAELRAHELALAGDRAGALAALADAADPVSRYNRFVLDPDSTDPDELRPELGDFAVLVDVVLFTLGRTDAAPPADGLQGELAAVVLSAQAGAALADGDSDTAIALLDRAAAAAAPVSKPMAGTLLAGAAEISRNTGGADAAMRLQNALAALDGADGLRVSRAEVHLCLAGVLHEQADGQPHLLNMAVPQYHSALQLIKREDAPELWAAAHAGLATAYLTMPMVEASSQLRLGVAAQSLRSALTVYTRETHPQEWASVQLNLANSLVYSPSRHHRENLVEAVEIYEAVLQTRDRTTDPLGRARVLANQGNVLAHLGMFDDAKAKLYEARFLFEELGDNDSVRAVRGVLDEIARQRVLSSTDDAGGSDVDSSV
jgi:tetratricopeptide (TPR) repeat protein